GLGRLRDVHTHPGKSPLFSAQDIISSRFTSDESGSLLVTEDSTAFLRFLKPVDLVKVDLVKALGLEGKNPTMGDIITRFNDLANKLFAEEVPKAQKRLFATDRVKKMNLEEFT